MRILIINLSSAGNIISSSLLVRCLKKQLPAAELHFLTKPPFQETLKANPYINNIHLLEEDEDTLITTLKELNFDVVIDLQKSPLTSNLKKQLSAKTYTYNNLATQKWLAVRLKINRLPDINIAERYLKAAASLGIHNDKQGLDYFIPDEARVEEKDIPASHLAGYIGLAIGGAYATRKMPAEKLKELCEKINHPIILLGGREELENGDIIASADPVKVYNACGKFTFNEQADLVRRAKLIVSHDNNLLQIAAAFRKQIISIWGNTIPEFGHYPYYEQNHLRQAVSPNFDVMENDHLSCRPCSANGYAKCPRLHFKCMRDLDINLILDEVERRLEAMSGIVL